MDSSKSFKSILQPKTFVSNEIHYTKVAYGKINAYNLKYKIEFSLTDVLSNNIYFYVWDNNKWNNIFSFTAYELLPEHQFFKLLNDSKKKSKKHQLSIYENERDGLASDLESIIHRYFEEWFS